MFLSEPLRAANARPRNLLKIHVCIGSTGNGVGSTPLFKDPAQQEILFLGLYNCSSVCAPGNSLLLWIQERVSSRMYGRGNLK